jgi:prepilin-type N-terminal cleavage/methylation domain-containing protein
MTFNKSQTGHGRRGFTLLEVMIVVGIMAMIMALTLPALRFAGQREPLDEAVEMISNLTAKARADSILERRKRLVIINLQTGEKGLAIFGFPEVQRQLTGHGQLRRRQGKEGTPWLQTDVSSLVETPLKVLGTNRFPDSVNFTPPEVFEIWFRPDGTCDGAEMTMSEGGQVYRLFLDPSTSLTEVTEE